MNINIYITNDHQMEMYGQAYPLHIYKDKN